MTEANDRGDWIQTASGEQYFVLDPRPEDFNIDDIATALSKECRYAGHCVGFYSVAQHSVIVSRTVPQRMALAGLLHDASEAYLHDITRPLKRSGKMEGYIELEERTQRAIFERFGLMDFWPMPPEVKHADNRALATERRDVIARQRAWREHAPPLEEKIIGLEWYAAKELFLDRYREITEVACNR